MDRPVGGVCAVSSLRTVPMGLFMNMIFSVKCDLILVIFPQVWGERQIFYSGSIC